jgi:hypothetical protein
MSTATPGELVEVRPEARPEGAAQGVEGGVGDIGDGAQPEPVQGLLGPVADAPEGPDRQAVEERHDVGYGDDEQAVRLGQRRGELRDELRRGDPDRAGHALLIGDGVAQRGGDERRRTEPTLGGGHVEEGLIEGERLDILGDRAEGGHD